MRKGFIFNAGKCVKCTSCSAACRLYNGWEVNPRNIYTYNEKVLPDIPLVNVSLACNHCEDPACMNGCPSGAFFRDNESGAVLIDQERCLGCRYCLWNCPYDAPKFDEKKKIIVKCNLCHSLNNGSLPACSTACPTGALSYGELKGSGEIGWFPRGTLDPAISFIGNTAPVALKVSPPGLFSREDGSILKVDIKPEWSLVLFSFFAMMSVATQVASFFRGIFPGNALFIQIALAAIISFFHLGRPFKAIKSLKNIRHSPLSREILFFLLFSILSLTATVMQSAGFAIAALVSGLILLVVIDSVYARPGRKILLHSGQTFLSGLLLVSYFTNSLLPLTFMVLVKTILTARQLILSEFRGTASGARFVRGAVLLICWAGLISGFARPGFAVTLIIVSSEFVDRILFYIDFEPENIRRNIANNINTINNEKKRG